MNQNGPPIAQVVGHRVPAGHIAAVPFGFAPAFARGAQAINPRIARLIRRRRRKARRNKYLPKRPTKPSTHYNFFVKRYCEQEMQRGGGHFVRTPPGVFRAASRAWRSATDEDKRQFDAQVAQDQERFDTEIAEWRAKRTALKRPPSAFGLYTMSYWKTGDNRQRFTFREMSRITADGWKNLTEQQKAPYQEKYNELVEAYRREMQVVYDGGVLNLTWRNLEMDPPAQIPPPANPQGGGLAQLPGQVVVNGAGHFVVPGGQGQGPAPNIDDDMMPF